MGMSLVSWSLDHFVPPPSPYGDEGRGCYFLPYVWGITDKHDEQDKLDEEEYKFWIEIKVDSGYSSLYKCFNT